MSIDCDLRRTLIEDEDGGAGGRGAATTILKHRFLSFVIWSSLQSTLLFISKTLLLYPFTTSPFKPSVNSVVYCICFYFSIPHFIQSLSFVSTLHPLPFAATFEITFTKTRLIKRVRVSWNSVQFVGLCACTTAVTVHCVCWNCDAYDDVAVWSDRNLCWMNVVFRGFVVGLLYGLHYVYKQRGVLQFPIIQRPAFFRIKMGIALSIRRALRFSAIGCLLSGSLFLFLPIKYRSQGSDGHFIVEHIIFYIGSFVCILRWELTHHLFQVLHTERFVFGPPKGSTAAETNPSEPVLITLEKSTPKPLLQYLAYLDLCMVCENNVDTWRRAAFFEVSGETYKRVIAAGLRPLEQFVQKLAEGLESFAAENSLLLSDQLSSSTEQLGVQKLYESFYDSQLCAWSARITSSLTARSRKEDRFAVAKRSGSNAAVISTLLSSLLAVETLMGKETCTQKAHLMGPAGIKWAVLNTGKRESPLYAKAYSLADILKASIYCIVSAFHNEMLSHQKFLQEDWIISGQPLYGTPKLLLDKLRVFLDFEAS